MKYLMMASVLSPLLVVMDSHYQQAIITSHSPEVTSGSSELMTQATVQRELVEALRQQAPLQVCLRVMWPQNLRA